MFTRIATTHANVRNCSATKTGNFLRVFSARGAENLRIPIRARKTRSAKIVSSIAFRTENAKQGSELHIRDKRMASSRRRFSHCLAGETLRTLAESTRQKFRNGARPSPACDTFLIRLAAVSPIR